jgi:hypothetical protein
LLKILLFAFVAHKAVEHLIEHNKALEIFSRRKAFAEYRPAATHRYIVTNLLLYGTGGCIFP